MCVDEMPIDVEFEATGQQYRVFLLNDHVRASTANFLSSSAFQPSAMWPKCVRANRWQFNMREYVSRVLMMVCDITEADAAVAMMRADWSGSAPVGMWERPVAEHVFEGLKKAGLQAAIEAAPHDVS